MRYLIKVVTLVEATDDNDAKDQATNILKGYAVLIGKDDSHLLIHLLRLGIDVKTADGRSLDLTEPQFPRNAQLDEAEAERYLKEGQ